MKESILRSSAIAALALALIMSVTTWIGVAGSKQSGSFLIGFFEFALILFLGIVAWALLNSLADIVTVRTSLEMLTVRLARIEDALGVPAAAVVEAAAAEPAVTEPAEPASGVEPEEAPGEDART